ncbi:sigma-54 dependent transcriptional regulator [Simiduia curdlanivorans]|uniref:Sigma-54-dependent transcriptional regulator n=1 Tax=Simiduia curdlanivorans TaxID=1492769 RepID=A0ABV8V5H7_9GAMM|nr:sigma-54 dependent transcriptional regulator [Simiduia curdlanivorans]MDN3641049.1 sigma-54 dependent transcriptional regulator [Simiduia curdlanivorans]
MHRVLLVDDDESFTRATKALIEHLGFKVDTAGDVKSARDYLTRFKYHTLLLDLMLPEGSGFDVIEGLPIDRTPDQIAFVTGHSAIKSMVKHMAGPDVTYLIKPIDLSQLQTLLAPKKTAVDAGYEYHFGSLVGESEPMQALYEVINRVAKTGANVLIQGESGTGKELVAQAIHAASGAQGPLVAANCGAISAELIGSELFGHEKGAFTGAVARKPGLFERANHGALFLDEVTEMPLEQQPNLLRVLETGKVTRLGGTEELTVDCRVISATNRSHNELAQGQYLREDIYFRLAVFPIELPPLRQRKSDIPLLCQAFLDQLNEQHGTAFSLDQASMDTLCRYDWPGNVRELRHALHRAFILSDQANPHLSLPAQLGSPFANSAARNTNADTEPREEQTGGSDLAVGTTIEAMERELINNTLAAVDGDKPKAAELLGISLKTLYNRLKQYKQEAL